MLGTFPSYVRRLDASDRNDDGPIDKLAFEIVLASSLKVGDLVLCTRGEVIPLDGLVVEGRATIADGRRGNPTKLTPVLTGAGLRVRQGTRLASGHVVVRVEEEENLLSR